MKKQLKVIECFAGIGAPRKALIRGGYDYKIIDAIEIDKYAVKSYNAIYGDTIEPRDILKYYPKKEEIGEIDLLFHGSPCTSFSLAGKQLGGDKGSGTPSSLMYESIRIIETIKPKIVIWENVKNLLGKRHRHNFDAYLETMEQLGYKNYYQVLNAEDYGIPQNRERVFTISIRNDLNINFEFPPKRELNLKVKDLLEPIVDEKYYLSDKMINYILDGDNVALKSGRNINNRIVNPDVAKTISCRGATQQRADVTNFVIDGKDEETTVAEMKGISYIRNFGSRGKLQEKEVCDTLTAVMGTGGGNVPLVKVDERMINEREIKEVTLTLSTQYGSTTSSATTRIKEKKPRIRKLTEKEAFRLMGFDDEDYEKASKVNSSTQLYKQAGNSIVVNVIEAIYDNLLIDYK